jgi:periplasmic copper chaperone A
MSAPSSLLRRAALATVFSALIAGAVLAAAPGRLAIRDAWTRPAAAGMNGAGYLTIVNGSALADQLVSASSPGAARVSIHESRLAGQVMTMRTLSAVAIPAGASVTFRPGGLHLMLEGLKAPLKAGSRVAVTLVFARAGRRSTTLAVGDGPPGAAVAGVKK